MKIEPITNDDINQLIELAREGHMESKYVSFPFSERDMATAYRSHISPDCLGIKAVIENKIIGFFLGSKNAFIFSERPIGMETCYYIIPEFRGSKCFLLLIQAFKDWCKERNLVSFLLPHFAEDNSKTYSALEKLGFKEAGRFYAGEF